MDDKVTAGSCIQFQLEFNIGASRARVWKAILEETNAWWLPDFHMVGQGSVVTFDPHPGGRGLKEDHVDGSCLLWYTVQIHLPSQFSIFLVGHVAPDWGGPATSNLKLALEESTDGCMLKVADAQHGRVAGESENKTAISA